MSVTAPDPPARPRRRRARRAALALGLTACLGVAPLALVACGGGQDPGVAQATTAGETTGGTTTEASSEEAQLDFARCMREQGVDFPDPEPDDDGTLRFRPPAGAATFDAEAFQRGAQECREFLRDAAPQLSEDQQTELRDAALKYARCMRENGVDVPDPSTGGTGPGGGALAQIDRDDPDFDAANQACERYIRDALPGSRP